CQKNELEPSPIQKDEVVNLIIDTDMGNSTDDLLAVQAAFKLQSLGRCKVLALMGSRGKNAVQRFNDGILHYYHADDVPLGITKGEESFFEIVPYYKIADELKEDGSPLLSGTGIPIEDRLESPKLYRKILGEMPDHSVTISCIGFATNLGVLMDSKPDEYSPLDGMELIRRKVKCLNIMGCCFAKVKQRYSEELLDVEYNVSGNIPLAQKVYENWPGKMCVFPIEGGLCFPSNHNQVLSDYAWQPDNPMYLVYSRYDEWATGDLGQYWWDVITMLHAILGEETFNCTESGTITIDDEGHSFFTPDADGNAHIISLAATQLLDVYEYLRTLSSFNPDR
ncbi:MAG: nucleoside hydrolase, partial [Bacteroidales bacterium]|nr:nucleoside hydrolase [Bacteroidales bacterium]